MTIYDVMTNAFVSNYFKQMTMATGKEALRHKMVFHIE
jgi:hypothetical protein